MTVKIIEVLNPTAKAASVEAEIAPRIDDLNGKVIGLLENGKPNADIFLSRVGELLGQNFKSVEIVYTQKPGESTGGGFPLPAEQMEKLATKCDAVVNGVGD